MNYETGYMILPSLKAKQTISGKVLLTRELISGTRSGVSGNTVARVV